MARIIVDVPKNEWLTANGRYHHMVKARSVKALRGRAALLARAGRLMVKTPTLVTVRVGYPTGGRADPDNSQPTVKALIDGFVDAGALTDDDSEHVVAITYMRGEKSPRGVYRMEFIFTPQDHGF